VAGQLVEVLRPHSPQSSVHVHAVLPVVWLNAALRLAADQLNKDLPSCGSPLSLFVGVEALALGALIHPLIALAPILGIMHCASL